MAEKGKKPFRVADLFCGAGGTSTGVALVCKELDYAVELLAINHWQTAIETHKKNHPWATHVCANVEAVDPRKVVPSGHLDLLVASPECIYHSTARGGKPINDQARASAWRVLEWCERLYVRNVLIENVPEFRGWGPLGSDDRPLKSMRGRIFRKFIEALEALNYRVEYRVLNAADFGAATSRRRLFILARKGSRKLRWPEPSHAKDAATSPQLFGKVKPWRAAREIIDWTVEGESIFTKKKPLVRNTLLRIDAGLARYGGPLAPLFRSALKAYMEGKSVGEPVEVALSNGMAEAFMTILRGSEAKQLEASVRSTSEPVPAILAEGKHIGLVQPSAFITPNNANNLPKSIEDPVPTVTGGNRIFLTEPKAFVLQQQSGGAPRPVDEPLPTIAGAGAQELVEPKAFIVPWYGERTGQEPRTHSVDQPLPTAPCSPKFGIVQPEAFIIPKQSNSVPQSLDGPMPAMTTQRGEALVMPEAFVVTPGGPDLPNGRSVEEPLPTVTCKDRMALVEPFVLNKEHSGANGKQVRSAGEPIPTITARGDLGLVEPIIVGAGGPERAGQPQSVNDPLKTVLTRNHKMLVQPILMPSEKLGSGKDFAVPCIVAIDHKGNGTNGATPVTGPIPTITGKARLGLAQPHIVQVNHGEGDSTRRSKSVDEPLPTITAGAPGSGMALVEPCIVEVNHGGSESGRVQSIEEPLKTTTAKNGKGLVNPAILKYYSNGDGKTGQSVEEPLDSVTCKQRFALVQPEVTRIGIDIRFRMFRTHELAAAMGFNGYQFTGTVEDQTRQIGNAVEVNVAKALVRALIEE